MGLGKFADAAEAVADVPVGFIYYARYNSSVSGGSNVVVQVGDDGVLVVSADSPNRIMLFACDGVPLGPTVFGLPLPVFVTTIVNAATSPALIVPWSARFSTVTSGQLTVTLALALPEPSLQSNVARVQSL